MDLVSLMGFRAAKNRLGRMIDGLRTAYLNPFCLFNYKPPRRANPLNDAEEGEVHQARQGDGAFDLRATSAVTQNGNDSPQTRPVKTDIKEHRIDPEHGSKLKPLKGQFTLKNQIQRTLFSTWANVLLVAAPAGITIWVLKIPGPAVFVVNFIAIVPLAAMLSYSTEQIALRTGEVLGGLINATFGNAVELIVAIIALTENQVTVVQTSLVGSILSNLLLVLGFFFFFGGINRPEQYFNTTVAQTAASLLALSVASLIVPTIFSHTPDFYTNDSVKSLSPSAVPQLSHGVSIILLLIYFSYLFFQLKTHSAVFNEETQKVAKKDIFKRRPSIAQGAVASGIARAGALNTGVRGEDGELNETMRDPSTSELEEEEGPEEPGLHLFVALGTLTICTVIIALCAEGLVSGIEPISNVVSEEFIGLILIPIVGNACEHATAVTVAVKDKMDLAIGVAIGSSMQVALFLIPLLVIIGWGIGNQEMTLAFDTFQIVVLFVAVLLVNYLIGDGKSHWLKGVQLTSLYVIIAVCAFYYPNGTGVMSSATA
ncbi:Calcium/proton exchanger [Xylariaceae sp. AK1471]|nr:Calcium/proton exchanger [Xylariaceae sp. AK1471]